MGLPIYLCVIYTPMNSAFFYEYRLVNSCLGIGCFTYSLANFENIKYLKIQFFWKLNSTYIKFRVDFFEQLKVEINKSPLLAVRKQ